MKGRTPTQAEAAWMSKVARLGCIVCRRLGISQPEVSIHHIDGRTKPGAHFLTIPLCARHHQLGGDGFIPVHPWKRRFEDAYGTQSELLEECSRLVEG
jgi:hypothetical protein